MTNSSFLQTATTTLSKSTQSLPVLGIVGPHPGAHRSTDNDQQLPQPYWGENRPVAPLNDSIQPQREQNREEQQAGVDQELAAMKEKYTQIGQLKTKESTT